MLLVVLSVIFAGCTPQTTKEQISPTSTAMHPLSTDSKYGLDELMDKASHNGLVKVIVGVRVVPPPDDWLRDPTAEATHRQNIGQAQDALLARMSAYHVTHITKFAYTPAISMTVDASALRFLDINRGRLDATGPAQRRGPNFIG